MEKVKDIFSDTKYDKSLTNRKKDNVRSLRMEKAFDIIYREKGYNIRRERRRKQQFAGTDVYIEGAPWANNKCVIIDEKVATDYKHAYVNLKSFCIELLCKNNPGQLGWIFKKDSVTDYYIFAWVDTDDDFRTIKAIEYVVVERKKILELLRSVGIKSRNTAKYLIDTKGKPGKNCNKYYSISKDYRMVLSNKMEEPLLFVVNRDYLKKIAVDVVEYNYDQWKALVEKDARRFGETA